MEETVEQPIPLNDLIAERLITRAKDGDTRSKDIEKVPSEVTKADFVKIEKNLASLGFFTPSSKRVRDEKAKTISFTKMVDGQRVEVRATIVPAGLYGLPITADQDKYLALQKIINDIQQEQGEVKNPIGFTSAQLLRLLRRGLHSGKNFKEVDEWLNVMSSTMVISEGAVYMAGQKRWVKDRFHVFDRAVSVGKELPDGSIADRNYVWLSTWQLENINQNYLLPVDFQAYQQLRNRIAKALVPLLQIWLYASRDEGTYVKRYDELAAILNVRCYGHLSRIKEQCEPSLEELKRHGYLADWKIERTADGKGFKIILKHGDKFHRDRRRRLGEVPAPEGRLESVLIEPSREPNLEEGSVNADLLEALIKRGINERQARHLLAGVSPDQPVVDQLEWADHVIGQGGSQIANPVGFYVSVVRDGVMPPVTFEPTSKRLLKEEAEKAEREEEAKEARLRQAYEEYLEGEIDDEIARLGPADYEARLTLKVEALTTEHATFATWGIDQGRRIARTALAKDIRNEIGYRLFDFTTFCRVQKMVGEPLGPPRPAQRAKHL